MTITPKHRHDPATDGSIAAQPARSDTRHTRREPLGLVSHWSPDEELAQQTDVYA